MARIPTPTTGSKVGIVYSTVNKHVRMHVYVDSDAEWATWEANLPPGCSIAYVPMSAHHAGHDVFHQAIATAVGLPTVEQMFTDGICAVVDNKTGLVEQTIMADALIDTLPGKTLINDQNVKVGDSWDHSTQQFTTPSVILPPKDVGIVRLVPEVRMEISWYPSGTIGTPSGTILSGG